MACAGKTTPKGWLPTPKEAQETAYGGWIELRYLENAEARGAAGELIAVSADSVWVLTDDQGLVIPTASVREGKLTGYAARSLRGWTLAGTLSSISNGAFLIFTMPAWLIGGSLANRSESRAAERKSPPLQWAELARLRDFRKVSRRASRSVGCRGRRAATRRSDNERPRRRRRDGPRGGGRSGRWGRR